MKKYSRKIRRCAAEMVKKAALVDKKVVDEIVLGKNNIIANLNNQLNDAIKEADTKATECIELTKQLGQARANLDIKNRDIEACESEYKKLVKSNDSFSKQYTIMQDDNRALRQENLELQKAIIDKDYKLHEKDKLLEEKDDLIKYLQTPWYRRIFKHGTIQD